VWSGLGSVDIALVSAKNMACYIAVTRYSVKEFFRGCLGWLCDMSNFNEPRVNSLNTFLGSDHCVIISTVKEHGLSEVRVMRDSTVLSKRASSAMASKSYLMFEMKTRVIKKGETAVPLLKHC
jgi:hypothetical protein